VHLHECPGEAVMGGEGGQECTIKSFKSVTSSIKTVWATFTKLKKYIFRKMNAL
jgi:hypothetical protein